MSDVAMVLDAPDRRALGCGKPRLWADRCILVCMMDEFNLPEQLFTPCRFQQRQPLVMTWKAGAQRWVDGSPTASLAPAVPLPPMTGAEFSVLSKGFGVGALNLGDCALGPFWALDASLVGAGRTLPFKFAGFSPAFTMA